MKLAGKRLRLGAAALLTTMTIGAALAPGVVAAHSPSVAPSVEHPATNSGKCYEQVVEYKYKRETFRTEHKYVKQTHERSRLTKSDPWGPWSAWTVWNGGSTTRWEGPNFSEEGDHDGQNDNNSTFDRDYRYVQTSETRQVSAGFETTGWLKAPPAGDGWVQTSQRTVNGERIPCDPQPETKVVYSNWADGAWECGDTTVTQTRTKTVTPYVLQDYKWVPGPAHVTTETQTRALTAAEIQTCKPDDRTPTYTEWTDGQWECGDTTVTQTRTRTDYSWVNTGGSTWELTSTTTVETQTRPLTAAEVQSCKPDDRQPTYSEWTDGAWECGDTTVAQTRTRTDFTWVNTGGSTWEIKATSTTETQTRDLTDSERLHCNPPSKDPKVDREDVGTPECGDTMIEVKVTTTTYSYTFNEQTDAWDETVTVSETTETRDLTDEEQFPCEPTEWTPPSHEPVCGPDNDTVDVPGDTGTVYYEDTGWVDGERTVTAYWTDDDSELDSWTFTDDSEACPEETTTTTEPESLNVTAIGPACLNEAPYIEMTFGDQAAFNGRPATVTFIDLDGNVVGTDTATYQAGATVRFVYPGASVDAAGSPVDWPGWEFNGSEWVVDPSDARLRDGLTVRVEVNPTAVATVSYPAVTAACAAPPPTDISTGGGSIPDPAPTTTGVVPTGELPQTGSSTGVLALVAAALLLAGGVALATTRRSTATN